MAAGDCEVPYKGDGGALEAAAEDGDDAQDDGGDQEGYVADAPFLGRGLRREDTAVEEQDGDFDGGHGKGPEEHVCVLGLRGDVLVWSVRECRWKDYWSSL